jgi:hypothetical protein
VNVWALQACHPKTNNAKIIFFMLVDFRYFE